MPSRSNMPGTWFDDTSDTSQHLPTNGPVPSSPRSEEHEEPLDELERRVEAQIVTLMGVVGDRHLQGDENANEAFAEIGRLKKSLREKRRAIRERDAQVEADQRRDRRVNENGPVAEWRNATSDASRSPRRQWQRREEAPRVPEETRSPRPDNRELENLRAHNAQLMEKAYDLERAAKESKKLITTLQEAAKEDKRLVITLQDAVKEKDEQVHTLEETVHTQSDLIAGMEADLQNSREFESAAKGSEQLVATLQKDIEDKEHLVEDLTKIIGDKEDQVADLEKILKDKEDEVGDLQHFHQVQGDIIRSLRANLQKSRELFVLTLESDLINNRSMIARLERRERSIEDDLRAFGFEENASD